MPKGGGNNRKLNEREVKQIRQILARTPLTQREIGELYGVHPYTISSIKLKKIWGDLD